jgi:hypothetical protein
VTGHTWHPIETAPRDGCPIIVYDPTADGVQIYVCLFNGADWQEAAGEQWGHWTPTHWMPLPDPPDTGPTP